VPWRIYFKDGVSKDGRIIARKVTSYADSGAYNRHTPYAVTKHAANIAGPYMIPNVTVDAYCVYTNRVPTSAMRGFGVTSASFATEVQMDKIARAVGMDPFAIRILNGYRNGDLRPYQKVVGDATLVEVVQAAADMIGHPVAEPYKSMHSWDRDYSPERPQPVRAAEGV
jgi:CO/xanthine dehydrogenase Mo-binding subunit